MTTSPTQTGRVALALAGARNMSRHELADLLDMDPATLSRKVNGSRPWNEHDLHAIRAAFGPDVDGLISDLAIVRATRQYQTQASAATTVTGQGS